MRMKVNEIVDDLSTEIICVIDKSGSMNKIKSDAIGGFNQFINEQKELEDDTRITLALFDSKYKKVYENIPLTEAKELNDDTYRPSSMTALYDAVGITIDEAKDRYKNDPDNAPDKVLFVILTDGDENSSREYDQKRIFEMIKSQTDDQDWEFIFLAANQDAMKTGTSIGVKMGNTQTFAASGAGINTVYTQMSASVKNYRMAKGKKFDNLMSEDFRNAKTEEDKS